MLQFVPGPVPVLVKATTLPEALAVRNVPSAFWIADFSPFAMEEAVLPGTQLYDAKLPFIVAFTAPAS